MSRQTSNIPRSLAFLRKLGFIPDKSESRMPSFSVRDEKGGWKQLPGKRKDLFGIADITAIHPELAGTVYVQVCTAADVAKHFTDATGKFLKLGKDDYERVLPVLLKTGNAFWLLEWARRRHKVKVCTKCGGQPTLVGDMGALLPDDCKKCKGRGFTGGGTKWTLRVWESYLDGSDEPQRRTLWSPTLSTVHEMWTQIQGAGDSVLRDERTGNLRGVFRGDHLQDGHDTQQPQTTRG